MTAGEKDCPFCAERIKVAAIKCRFCGEHLTSTSQTVPIGEKESSGGAVRPLSKMKQDELGPYPEGASLNRRLVVDPEVVWQKWLETPVAAEKKSGWHVVVQVLLITIALGGVLLAGLLQVLCLIFVH